MTIRVLWPNVRGIRNQIELAALGEDVSGEWGGGFANFTDEQWVHCDGIVGTQPPAECMAKLKKCRIFVQPAVGFDDVDLPSWSSRGIAVCNVPDYGTGEVADHAIALMLTLT